MLKIFLIEDEFVVREGIKNNIDWNGEGFDFCGEAPDGELAYPMIQQLVPDIIITDIRMPFMDGLELSKLVKRSHPDIRIIIVSGHEEFRYAQEAIKIGVTEYLLKPVNSVDLLKAVRRVGHQILFERAEKENIERYRREMEENQEENRRRFFNEMVSGSRSSAELIEKGRGLGIELSAGQYQIILFRSSTAGGGYSAQLLDAENALRMLQEKHSDVLMFDRALEGMAWLIKGDTGIELDMNRRHFLNEVSAVMATYPQLNFFGGIGESVGRLTSLGEAFESAARVFAHRFISENNRIIDSRELNESSCEKSEAIISVQELGSLDLKKADAFLRSGDQEEILFFVEEFLKGISRTSDKSYLFRQYVLMNIYFTVLAFLKEIDGTQALAQEPLATQEEMRGMMENQEKARDYMLRIFKIAIEQRDQMRNRGYHRMIEQAKDYILNHYMDENISLNEIAAYVNISPSHFSTVFSRETGSSFIKYLTDMRMNKAKELLKCTDMRCSDISFAVGYKDPHYFSALFKRANDCSPKQYRVAAGRPDDIGRAVLP